jgi:hypothetical protein
MSCESHPVPQIQMETQVFQNCFANAPNNILAGPYWQHPPVNYKWLWVGKDTISCESHNHTWNQQCSQCYNEYTVQCRPTIHLTTLTCGHTSLCRVYDPWFTTSNCNTCSESKSVSHQNGTCSKQVDQTYIGFSFHTRKPKTLVKLTVCSALCARGEDMHMDQVCLSSSHHL